MQRVLTVRDGVHDIPLFLQAATHGSGHLEFVFDHEDPHVAQVSHRSMRVG